MIDRRFSKVLTVLLVIIILATFVALGFWGYDILQRHYINKNANEAVEEFDKKIAELQFNTIPNEGTLNETTQNEMSNQTNSSLNENSGNTQTGNNRTNRTNNGNSNNSSATKISQKYKGFDVVGKIQIPKIKLNYPILSVATISSMEVAIGMVYGPGPNEIGNTCLMGHNYRNGALFSNNDTLSNGDLVYITDLTGRKIEYKIYNMYYTTSTDFDYATRDTGDKREISMESCSDDNKSRLIIWAQETGN